jgi:hypothetical protein
VEITIDDIHKLTEYFKNNHEILYLDDEPIGLVAAAEIASVLTEIVQARIEKGCPKCQD